MGTIEELAKLRAGDDQQESSLENIYMRYFEET